MKDNERCCIKMKICKKQKYLPLYFSIPGVFFANRLMELAPPFAASIMAKFEQFLRERFGSILKRSWGHKNSEWPCYCNNLLISIKKMMRTEKAVSS